MGSLEKSYLLFYSVDDTVLIIPKRIDDGRWHVVEYKREKNQRQFTVIIDNNERTRKSKLTTGHRVLDYNNNIHLGETIDTGYRYPVVIQDFTWRWLEGKLTNEIDLVSELFMWYHNRSNKDGTFEYLVTPENRLPHFNRKLPVIPRKKTTPHTTETPDQPCVEGGKPCGEGMFTTST